MTPEELAQIQANIAYLNAQTMRINTLLQMENDKIRAEVRWYSVVPISGLIAAIGTILGVVVAGAIHYW
jgi:hypothetical protein